MLFQEAEGVSSLARLNLKCKRNKLTTLPSREDENDRDKAHLVNSELHQTRQKAIAFPFCRPTHLLNLIQHI